MTSTRGETPKLGGGHYKTSKVQFDKITNRTIGVRVSCGPIDGHFLYHSDNLVKSGANYMIEVVRYALEDLDRKLKNVNLVLPEVIGFWFDNCGENKNKEMFCYLSMLVEAKLFKTINVNFLIVGHTHCSIDQYFGTLTTAVNSAKFIGSPLSLWNLYDSLPLESKPIMQRPIKIVHDYKTFFSSHINKDIKYFQVPHCFTFRLVAGRASMKYKLFSTHKVWLPLEPIQLNLPTETIDKLEISSILLSEFNTVDGLDNFISYIEPTKSITSVTDTVMKEPKKLNAAREIKDSLLLLEIKSIDQQIKRLESESKVGKGGNSARYHSSQIDITQCQSHLRNAEDANKVFTKYVFILSI